MVTADVTFKVTVQHSPEAQWHEWFFPNGWRGIGPVERRDRRGSRQGERDGYYREWLVLACNNAECEGRAVVPISFLLDHADAMDPTVKRMNAT